MGFEHRIKAFKDKITEIYPNEFEEVLSFHNQNEPKTFRINILKTSPKKVLDSLKSQGFIIEETGLPNAYICLESIKNIKLSETIEFDRGDIYIQNLSSMLPVLILDPKQSEKILDMCASPGSKTTQIYEITKGKAEIVASEKIKSRFFKMKDTLKRYDANNVRTILTDAKILPFKFKEFENYFDKILLDAPCSNEANLKFFSMIDLKNWNPKISKGLSVLQKGLINSAVKMLKPGGTLVYSTCTYSVLENENVVDYALEKNPNLELVDFKINLPNIKNGFLSFKNKEFDQAVEKTIRILPDGYFSGFYIAKFTKDGDNLAQM